MSPTKARRKKDMVLFSTACDVALSSRYSLPFGHALNADAIPTAHQNIVQS
jgi:hypothetical protein